MRTIRAGALELVELATGPEEAAAEAAAGSGDDGGGRAATSRGGTGDRRARVRSSRSVTCARTREARELLRRRKARKVEALAGSPDAAIRKYVARVLSKIRGDELVSFRRSRLVIKPLAALTSRVVYKLVSHRHVIAAAASRTSVFWSVGRHGRHATRGCRHLVDGGAALAAGRPSESAKAARMPLPKPGPPPPPPAPPMPGMTFWSFWMMYWNSGSLAVLPDRGGVGHALLQSRHHLGLLHRGHEFGIGHDRAEQLGRDVGHARRPCRPCPGKPPAPGKPRRPGSPGAARGRALLLLAFVFLLGAPGSFLSLRLLLRSLAAFFFALCTLALL